MKTKVFFLALTFLAFTFGGVSANVALPADAPASSIADPMSLQKAEDLLSGTTAAKSKKEARKISKVKSKMEKLAKKIKKAKKRGGDLGGLLITIGIILMIVGLVGIILSVLGIASGLAGGGGGALILGLILYLIGKFAF